MTLYPFTIPAREAATSLGFYPSAGHILYRHKRDGRLAFRLPGSSSMWHSIVAVEGPASPPGPST